MRLKSFTEEPKAIARYGPLQSEDGRSFTLKCVRPAGGGSPDLVIARVEGVAIREAAAALIPSIQDFHLMEILNRR